MEKYTNLLVAVFICFASVVLAEASTRITNGRPAAENQFPYVVSLQYRPGGNISTRGHFCGGVLIDYQFVLTLASCTNDVVNDVLVPINVTDYRVFAGTNLTNDASLDRVRSIHNITIHPDYIPTPARLNDIAIIWLQTPFPNTTVVPLPLPSRNFAPEEYTRCVSTGWGSNDISSMMPMAQLQYMDMYVYDYSICRLIYNVQPNVLNIFPSMICAASYDIVSSSCLFDFGNPLVCNGTLTGLLLQHTGCSAQTASYPEVFIRLSAYSEWIDSIIRGSASTFIPSVMSLAILSVLQMILAKNIVN